MGGTFRVVAGVVMGSSERGRVPRYVFALDRRTGAGHIVDEGSFGVPAALALCGHRLDLREPVTSWAVAADPGYRPECLRCLRSVR